MRLPRYTWTVLITLALLAGLVVAFRPQPIAVELAPVRRGVFQQTIDKDGKTRVRQRYTVSAPLAGMVQRLPWKVGDVLHQGALVATIAPSAPPFLDLRTEHELTERVGAAEAAQQRTAADTARVQAVLAQAQTDLRRARHLSTRGLVSQGQLEQAELAVATARRQLEAAQQAEHAAEHDLAAARAALLQLRGEAPGAQAAQKLWHLYAPVPGRVLKVWQESAGVVSAGTPLLDLADATDLEVVVDLLSTEAVRVQPGMPVFIERSGLPQPLDGRVRMIEPVAFTKVSALGVEEQRVNVLIDLVSPYAHWQELGDNYRVEVRILVLHRDQALTLPTSALFRVQQRWMVFVLTQGRAATRAVTLGPRNAVEALVDSGVVEGEQVIVYPSDAVRDGVRVQAR